MNSNFNNIKLNILQITEYDHNLSQNMTIMHIINSLQATCSTTFINQYDKSHDESTSFEVDLVVIVRLR